MLGKIVGHSDSHIVVHWGYIKRKNVVTTHYSENLRPGDLSEYYWLDQSEGRTEPLSI